MKKFKLKNFLLVILGNFILAIAVEAFIVPNGIIMGGATGLALTFNHLFNFGLPLIVGLINIILFTVAYIFKGKHFALATIISTISFPIFLKLLEPITYLKTFCTDPLLATIYGGLLLGIGIGIVIKANASTGGLDILALIIHKYFRLPVAPVLYLFDSIVLLSQLPFSNSLQILYGIILTLLSSFFLNKTIIFGKAKIEITIISNCYTEIKQELLYNIKVGATLYNIENPYANKQSKAIVVITNSYKMHRIISLIRFIDSKAFVIVKQINEVLGENFSSINNEEI